jgi:hypothetical protein
VLIIQPGIIFIGLNYAVVFEKVTDRDFPPGYYCAHVPALALTTHGLGVDGARAALADLIQLRVTEKEAHGEAIPPSA